MRGRQQVLAALLAPAHRAAQGAGQRGDGQLLAIHRDLLAEAAADVGTDDGDLQLGQAEPGGEHGAIRVRHLGADMHGEVLTALVPHGAAAARLHRHVGLAVLHEAGFHHLVRIGEAAVRIAGGKTLVRHQIVRQRVVHVRGARGERRLDAGHVRQLFVIDPHVFYGVIGNGAVGGDDAGDRVAVEAHLGGGERLDGDRMQALDRRRDPQWLRPLRQVVAGGDHHHAWQGKRFGRVDGDDARVGVQRADEPGMQRAGDGEVVDETRGAGEEAAVLAARDVAADRALFCGHAGGFRHPAPGSNAARLWPLPPACPAPAPRPSVPSPRSSGSVVR